MPLVVLVLGLGILITFYSVMKLIINKDNKENGEKKNG